LGGDVFWAGLGILVAAGFHFVYFMVDSEHIAPDSPSYLGPAISVLGGKGFVGLDGLPETMRTPGYPLFLTFCAAMGMGIREVVLVQHLLSAGLAGGVYYLARSLGTPKGLAFLACLLYGLDFPSLQAANRVLTEAPFTLVLFLVVWIAIEWTRKGCTVTPFAAALAGFLGGLSALVRPISVFYIAPLGVALWISAKKRRLLNLIVLAASFITLPLAWAYRNQREAGVFSLSSITGESLLFWRAAGVLAIGEEGDFDTIRAFHAERLRKIAVDRLAANGVGEASMVPHAKKAEVYSHLAREILLDHPWSTFVLTVKGAGAALLGGGGVPISRLTGLPHNYARFIGAVYGAVCFFCFMLGIHLMWKANWRAALFLLITVGYFTLIPAGGEAYSRFRVPVVPCYVVGVSLGVREAISILEKVSLFRKSRDASG
jgi:hypothetical protein